MNGVNKAILVGHLGADPDSKPTQSGAPRAQFSVATSKSWRDKTTGERRERTEWHRVVIFNEGLVKVASQFLKKGSKVYIEGEMATRKWKDQNGVERWITEIVLAPFSGQIVLLDRAERAPAPDADSYGTDSNQPSNDMNDDIPF